MPACITVMRAGGAKRRKLALPVLAGGVRVVGDDEETSRAPEMQRLLRQPRCGCWGCPLSLVASATHIGES